MILNHLKKSTALLLGAGALSLMMSGCGSDGASGVKSVAGGSQMVITEQNADKVLASTVGSVGALADAGKELVDRLMDTLNIGKTVGGNSIASSGESKTVPGNVAYSLDDLPLSSSCPDGGSVDVKKRSTSATVTFDQCVVHGSTVNGKVEVSVNVVDRSGELTLTNVNVQSNTSSISLSNAGITIEGKSKYELAIGSGSVNRSDVSVDVTNLNIAKSGGGIAVNGQIKTSCMDGYVDLATLAPLTFSGVDLLTGGSISINGAGNSNINLSVNPDGSVDATLNGASYEAYDSALDFPRYSDVCQ